MQKYSPGKYPFLGLNYNSEEIDKSIVDWIKNVEKPAYSYSEDAYNIPLPEQTAEEVECLLKEPPAEDVPLPKQTEEDLKSLQNVRK